MKTSKHAKKQQKVVTPKSKEPSESEKNRLDSVSKKMGEFEKELEALFRKSDKGLDSKTIMHEYDILKNKLNLIGKELSRLEKARVLKK